MVKRTEAFRLFSCVKHLFIAANKNRALQKTASNNMLAFVFWCCMSNTSYADVNSIDWCSYSGSDRARAAAELRQLIVGKELSTILAMLSEQWKVTKTKTPKALLLSTPELNFIVNTKNFSFTEITRFCKDIEASNSTGFFVVIESIQNKITNADVEIRYYDKNFRLRGEKLDYRRYFEPKPFRDAIASLHPVGTTTYQEWMHTMEELGFTVWKSCETKQEKRYYLEGPQHKDGLWIRMGSNLHVDYPIKITGVFDHNGKLIHSGL